MNRRELLAGFLGAAVCASACRRARRKRVPGEILDRAATLEGHRLRGHTPLPRSQEPPEPLDVAIVGGGAAGLAAAWRLAGAGLSSFRLLELEDAPGGTSRSGRSDVTEYPLAAHYLPAPLSPEGAVPRMLREMGVLTGVGPDGVPELAEEALLREPDERVFYRGAWYEGLYLRAGASPEDVAQLARFEEAMAAFARARDAKGRRAFDIPAAASSDDAEWTALDRLSFAQWLEKERFTSGRLLWLADYACRDDFGARLAQTSAWAGIWYFSARQDGEGRRSEGYLTWPEGNARLMRHLARSSGEGRISTQMLVHEVSPDASGVTVHALDAKTGAPRAFRARHAILCTPRFVTARLLPRQADWAPNASHFVYSPWVVANVHVPRPPRSRGFPLAWDNVLYDSQSLGYVVATHQRTMADDSGPTVLTWYHALAYGGPMEERSRALALSYEEWEELVMGDLLRVHPDLVATRIEVQRWGHAMIRPRPGFVWSSERVNGARVPWANVHLAHSELSGVAMLEDAIHHGVTAAERALALLRGAAQESWIAR